MTYDFAPHVVIDHDAHTLTVGGTEFPWCLTKEGPQVRFENDTALVTLTFMADSAEVRPRSADGDTGTRAIAEPGKTFVRYTEHNDHEGETWTFWLQRDGNENALRWLADFLADVNAEDLDPEHELFLDDVIPEEHVDVLAKWGGEAYMPLHNKVIGTMSIPEKFSPGDLYKGDVAELFAVVSDGE